MSATGPAPDPAKLPSLGGEVAPTLLGRLATSHGLHLVDWGVEAAELGKMAAPGILVTLRGFAREIAASLALGTAAYVELDDDAALPSGLLNLLAGPPCLHISLSTATCFSLDLAPLLCSAMLARGWLGVQRRGDVEICVHEAINNAVVHGNLDIHQGPSTDTSGFDSFFRTVQARLEDRTHAARRVTVEAVAEPGMLRVAVKDQGRGHPGHLPVMLDQLEAKSGRGIRIMSELADRVAFADGGRTTKLHFRR